MTYHRVRIFFLSLLLLVIAFMANIEPASAISWSAHINPLTADIDSDYFPFITQTNDGRIWVVWSRDVYGFRALFYKTSFDMGKTWSQEMNLTEATAEHENTKPSIMQTTDGKIWVFWASNRPPPPLPPGPDFNLTASPTSLTIPKNSSDTSTITIASLNNFSAPVELWVPIEPENVTTTLNPSEVTPPQNGTANLTLTVSVGPTATPGNYTLTVIGKSQKVHTVDIALEITEFGTLSYTSYSSSPPSSSMDDYEIYYRTSSDNGATWSGVTQFTENTIDDLTPSLTQAANGTIFIFWESVIWEDGEPNEELFYEASSDGGTSWSNATRLTFDPDPDTSPSATQTRDGKIWVTWASERTGNWEIFYKTNNGSSWSNAMGLSDSARDIDVSPSIMETICGKILIFWSSREDTLTERDDIYYKYSIDGGDTWSVDRIRFTTDENYDMWPSATQTSDIKIWVVWTSNRTGNHDLLYRTSLVGDITGPENPPSSGEYPPDGTVDTYDLTFVCNTYGDKEGDPNWNESKIADITGPENPPASRQFPPDGIIDIYDLAIVSRNYGTS